VTTARTTARTTIRADDRKRVLVIVQNLHVPFDRRVWLECGSLTRAGYDVTVICPRGPESKPREVIEGVTVRTYAARDWGKGGAGFVAEFTHSFLATTLLALDERRRGGPWAVVQACNPPDVFWPLARLLRLLDGSSFVFDHHDLCPELYESRFPHGARAPLRALLWLERRTFRTADRVISTNDSYAEIARRRGGKRPEHVTVVRTGPDPDFLSPGPPVPAARRGHAHLAAYLGVMGPQDGVDLVIAAADIVVHRMERTDIAFTLMGSGDCFEALVAQRDRLGLQDHVELTGRVPDETVREVLRTADVGLCPDPRNPLNDVSTMNKTMEYMAFGLPVVAFDLKETRVSAQDAAVYAEEGAQALAEALVALVDDPDRRARLSARGRELVVEKLAWVHQQKAYVRVFDALTGRRALTAVEG
jgi:glycosyltransferase involved in cell wall biosynthesis